MYNITKEEIKTAIDELKAKQNPKVDYAKLVCAEISTYGQHYVWEDPLDYAIETALQVLQNELNRIENNLYIVNLPYKIGDTVYMLVNRVAVELEIQFMYIGVKGIQRIYAKNKNLNITKNFRPSALGKTVFLNKEELIERNNKNGN